jgi:hypothetical protein
MQGSDVIPTNSDVLVRSPGARFAVPSENEWMKAGYYRVAIDEFYSYPTQFNDPPTCAAPYAGAMMAANCDRAVSGLLDIGLYAGSPGPYGTFDQAGNASEMLDTLGGSGNRYVTGGHWANPVTDTRQGELQLWDPTFAWPTNGLRLVALPEPVGQGGALAVLGVLAGLRGRSRGHQNIHRPPDRPAGESAFRAPGTLRAG